MLYLKRLVEMLSDRLQEARIRINKAKKQRWEINSGAQSPALHQKGRAEMKTYHKEYGITASITDKLDGTARLLVKDQYGRKVKDSIHKNRSAAVAAWRRLCS